MCLTDQSTKILLNFKWDADIYKTELYMVLIKTLPGVSGCHIDDVSCRGLILLAFEDIGLTYHIFINAECLNEFS